LVFKVPNALILTVVATISSVIPLIGPGLVYVPATIYLGVTGEPFLAIIYLLYNLLIVSTVDNLIRAHLISRKTKASQAVILVGMISGLFVFGLLGLIIGPLVLIYFITFLKAYKDKTLSSLFSAD
jgi:predicted PurR-regulated permease PerM